MTKKRRIDKPPRSAERGARSEQGSLPVVPLIALVTIALGYLVVFYAAVPERLEYWRTLVLPDVVWSDWTGGTGWPAILDRVPVWLIAGWYLTAAYSAGSLTLRALRLDEFAPLERFVFAISIGLGLLSTFTLAVGLAGGLHWSWLFRAIAGALPIAEILLSWTTRTREVEPGTRNPAVPRHWSLVIGHWSLFVFVAIYLLAGTTPPREFDVLEYHLQVPKEWFQSGQIGFLPHNVYGNMPLGAEMHALACMELWMGGDAWWHGALAGKVVITLFAPLTALAIYAAALRWFSAPAGILAAAIYLSFPWIAHVSFQGLIDSVLAHYTFVAIYFAMIAGNVGQGTASSCDWRTALLAGFLAGSAAACKYPGMVFVVVPVVLIVVISAWSVVAKEGLSRLARFSAAMLIVGIVAAACPWYVKNAAITGNPVYPLAARWLDGRTRTPDKIEQWEKAHQVPRDENGNRYALGQFVTAKKQIVLTSQWLSPIAWPLAVLGIAATWRRRETWLLLGITYWIFGVWFFATHRIDRFWLPAVPMLCLIAGAAWEWSSHRIYRVALGGIAAVGILGSTLTLLAPIEVNERLLAISDPRWLTSLDNLRQDQNEPHRRLSSSVKEGEAVLLVGDAQPFDLAMPVYYNTCFDDCVFELLTKDRSSDEIRAAFDERRIAYVLVDWAEIRRYRSPGNYGFTDYVQREVFEKLVREGVLVAPAWQGLAEDEVAWAIYSVGNQPEMVRQREN